MAHPACLPLLLLLQAECDELQRQLLETQRLLESNRRELKHAFEQVEEARAEADARVADAQAAGVGARGDVRWEVPVLLLEPAERCPAVGLLTCWPQCQSCASLMPLLECLSARVSRWHASVCL